MLKGLCIQHQGHNVPMKCFIHPASYSNKPPFSEVRSSALNFLCCMGYLPRLPVKNLLTLYIHSLPLFTELLLFSKNGTDSVNAGQGFYHLSTSPFAEHFALCENTRSFMNGADVEGEQCDPSLLELKENIHYTPS